MPLVLRPPLAILLRPRRVVYAKYDLRTTQRRYSRLTPGISFSVGRWQFRQDSARKGPWKLYVACATVLGGTCYVTYENSRPFRHAVLAIVRCSRVAGEDSFYVDRAFAFAHGIQGAAINSAIDYKLTMVKKYNSAEEENEAYSECHTRSARRVLRALLANGGMSSQSDLVGLLTSTVTTGIFIKLGQHMASLIVLPSEWRNTMRILQDKCEPTPHDDLEALFAKDMGGPISDFFSDFEAKPIGVASLAQVHSGHLKGSGQRVAVKVNLKLMPVEFC